MNNRLLLNHSAPERTSAMTICQTTMMSMLMLHMARYEAQGLNHGFGGVDCGGYTLAYKFFSGFPLEGIAAQGMVCFF